MKNTYKLVAIGATLVTLAAKAQTVSTFESLLTTPNTYWDGSDSTNIGGFADGNAIFGNDYSWDFFYWSGGFAVSNKADTSTADTTSGFSQMYNAITPGGAEQSVSYAIAQNGSTIVLSGAAAGKQADGIYITNSNYAYLSMKWGDQFAKQFTDSDYFMVNIVGYLNGEEADTAIALYLADGTNLLNTWEWVDLKPLGDVDSIGFYLESSDTGQWGMNTPAFFCIDNFTTRDIRTSVNQIAAQLKATKLYPNPATDVLTIETTVNNGTALVFDITGKLVQQATIGLGRNTVSIESLTAGIYFVQVKSNGITETRKLVVR